MDFEKNEVLFQIESLTFRKFSVRFFFERVALSSKPQTLTPIIIILGQNICGILSLVGNEYGSIVVSGQVSK